PYEPAQEYGDGVQQSDRRRHAEHSRRAGRGDYADPGIGILPGEIERGLPGHGERQGAGHANRGSGRRREYRRYRQPQDPGPGRDAGYRDLCWEVLGERNVHLDFEARRNGSRGRYRGFVRYGVHGQRGPLRTGAPAFEEPSGYEHENRHHVGTDYDDRLRRPDSLGYPSGHYHRESGLDARP